MKRDVSTCLGRVALGVSFVSLLLAGPMRASAQEVELPELILVGESASGVEVPLERPGVSGAASVGEAVAAEAPDASVQVGSRGQTTLSWRGFDERQVSAEYEGVELNLPYDGGLDLGRLGLGLLTDALLVPGSEPGGAGSAALGGSLVMNGLQVPEAWGGSLRLDGSWPWGGGAVAKGGGPLGHGWGLAAGVEGVGRTALPIPVGAPATLVRHESGERSNSYSWNVAGNLKLEKQWASGQRSWASWLTVHGAYGVPPDMRTYLPRHWQWEDWSMELAVVGHESEWSDGLRTKLWVYGLLPRNTLQSYDDDGYDTQDSQRAFTTRYRDYRMGHRGLLAWRWRQEEATLLPTRLEARWGVRRDAHEEESSEPEGLLLEEWRLESSVGLRSGRWNGVAWGAALSGFLVVPGDLPGHPSVDGDVSPGAWVGWRRGEVGLKASFSRRVRFPTLKERYTSVVSYRIANPDLRPEEALNLAVELRWTLLPNVLLLADAHGAKVSDLIAEEVVGDGTVKLDNLDQSTLAGGGLALQADPWEWLTTWVKGAGLYAHTSRSPGYLANRPHWRGQAGATIRPAAGLELSGRARIEGPQHFQDRMSGQWGELGSYLLADAWITFKYEQWSTFASVQNIGNTWYETSWGFPGSGRWFQLGCEYSF